MNSCLYRCEVMHHRLFPTEHKFRYNVFMFYVDLDELEMLGRNLLFFSNEHFNWFNFRKQDHLQFPLGGGHNDKTVKQNIQEYLLSQGVTVDGKIMLMTNVATLGYSFNPISFYLCFDKGGVPVCSVAEVCNTHGEMKLYVLDKGCFSDGTFSKLVSKYFYVSPFSDLEASFNFIFKVPSDNVTMRVDDHQEGKRFFMSSLTGRRKKLSDVNLILYGLRFPFITIKIMFSIYWQAFVLRLKRVPYHDKNFNLHLQKENFNYKKA